MYYVKWGTKTLRTEVQKDKGVLEFSFSDGLPSCDSLQPKSGPLRPPQTDDCCKFVRNEKSQHCGSVLSS